MKEAGYLSASSFLGPKLLISPVILPYIQYIAASRILQYAGTSLS